MITGALLINKEIGNTSRQEVNKVSRVLHEKKAGHIGTLDPFADGLLIVLLGRATKVSPFIEALDKTYLAKLKLGIMTDTGDHTGAVIEEKEVPQLTVEKIKETLKTFLGIQLQIPPKYSALKVNGERAYALARKNVDFELESRQIEVFEISLVNFNGSDELTFLCRVSKGTYVRTLGEDIAKALGTIGTLESLTRCKIGKYSLENAKKADDVTVEDLLSIDKMLENYPSVMLDEEDAKKAMNGMTFVLKNNHENLVVLKDLDGPIAMYEKQADFCYKCLRGLR